MSGAIFYSGQYGSTAQYSQWISEATGLPAFSIDDPAADPSAHDFLVLGSSIVFYKPTIRGWLERHRSAVMERPVVFFTVSGAPAGPKLDGWIAKSLPADFLDHVEHVALQGRLDHDDVSWWLRIILKVGSLLNPDREASKEERHGFDHLDQTTIRPIVELAARHQAAANRSHPRGANRTDASTAQSSSDAG